MQKLKENGSEISSGLSRTNWQLTKESTDFTGLSESQQSFIFKAQIDRESMNSDVFREYMDNETPISDSRKKQFSFGAKDIVKMEKKQEVDLFKDKLQKNGRCPICTLVPPCNHYKD